MKARYEVDAAMMGESWNPEIDSLQDFCEMLENILEYGGIEADVVAITGSYNGAQNAEEIPDDAWGDAIDEYYQARAFRANSGQ